MKFAEIIKSALLLFLLSCAYLAIFICLYLLLKSPAVVTVSLIFVSYIAWTRGTIAGLTLTAFNFFWNAITFNILLPGYAMPLEAFISIGVHLGISGLLGLSGRLSRNLQKEVEVRKETEAKLTQYQNELEQLVAERTQELEESNEKLRHAEKMEAIGQLAGGVAHDFNNMLSVILGYTELILEKSAPDAPHRIEMLEIRKAARHSADITRQLLAFARKQTVAPKVLNLNQTVEGMLRMLGRLIGESVELKWVPGANPALITIDPSQLDQILANLCVNARDAVAGKGLILIETDNVIFDEDFCNHHREFVPGEYVVLVVSDNGIGMDEHALKHLYEPFFTTKKMEQGTGLGLATVYGIVKQNNGCIRVSSTLGEGTTFSLYFPCVYTATEVLPELEKNPSGKRGSETILLVEDEPALLAMTKAMLEREGYRVLAASVPSEAIRLVREYPHEIDLLLTDVVMPEMNGREMAEHLLAMRPGLRQLYISGYSENIIANHGMLNKGLDIIQKPFTMESLYTQVRASLSN